MFKLPSPRVAWLNAPSTEFQKGRWILFVSLLFVWGCQKQPIEQVATECADGSVKSASCAQHNVSTDCGGLILSFPTESDYQTVYDCLQASMDAYEADMMALYGTLSEEALNDQLDLINWDEQTPLRQFENALSFYSYRQWYRQLEDAWILNGMDPATDPDDYCLFFDPIVQTLFGQCGAIKIAGVIYYNAPNGQMFSITNGDCKLLEDLIADPDRVDNPNVVEFEVKTLCADCFQHRNNKNDYYYDNNKKRIKWKHRHHIFLLSSSTPNPNRMEGVQKSYRKKLGIWWRYKAVMTIILEGEMIDETSCDRILPYYTSQTEYLRSMHLELDVSGGGDYQCWRDCNPQATFIADQVVVSELCI